MRIYYFTCVNHCIYRVRNDRRALKSLGERGKAGDSTPTDTRVLGNFETLPTKMRCAVYEIKQRQDSKAMLVLVDSSVKVDFAFRMCRKWRGI